MHLDVKAELCAGCGVCVNACPYDVIRLSRKRRNGPHRRPEARYH